MCLIRTVWISHDESNHMADGVGGWYNLFDETSGKLYVDLSVFDMNKL
jgi:hypothetical protein